MKNFILASIGSALVLSQPVDALTFTGSFPADFNRNLPSYRDGNVTVTLDLNGATLVDPISTRLDLTYKKSYNFRYPVGGGNDTEFPQTFYFSDYYDPVLKIYSFEYLNSRNYFTTYSDMGVKIGRNTTIDIGVRGSGIVGGNGQFTLTLLGPGMVPEPETWALMIVGFLFVGSVSRRRRLMFKKNNCIH